MLRISSIAVNPPEKESMQQHASSKCMMRHCSSMHRSFQILKIITNICAERERKRAVREADARFDSIKITIFIRMHQTHKRPQ